MTLTFHIVGHPFFRSNSKKRKTTFFLFSTWKSLPFSYLYFFYIPRKGLFFFFGFSVAAMTEVLHFSSSSSPATCSSDGILQEAPPPPPPSSSVSAVVDGFSTVTDCDGCGVTFTDRTQQQEEELSLLAILVTLLRKSLIACNKSEEGHGAMEIGWPTNVRHVAHVTFDRFNGFLGLPREFEPEVSTRPPSARYVPCCWLIITLLISHHVIIMFVDIADAVSSSVTDS